MTLRETIADWISGGAVARANLTAKIEAQFADKMYDAAMSSMKSGVEYRRCLREIAAMETTGANATVRRMAARAREAFE